MEVLKEDCMGPLGRIRNWLGCRGSVLALADGPDYRSHELFACSRYCFTFILYDWGTPCMPGLHAKSIWTSKCHCQQLRRGP